MVKILANSQMITLYYPGACLFGGTVLSVNF